ncbi:MAG: M1 family metallopeptidase [Ignavibacteriaceae bacterium]|nr:M1 family metallopeptidase [Ignavibacteriaceae bacterium]
MLPGFFPAGLLSGRSNIDVLHYDLKFDLYPDVSLLKGDAVITAIQKDKSSSEIDLDFYDNMKISALTLNGQKVEFTNKDNMLHIKYLGSIDTFKVEIIYEGTPKHVGFSGFVFGEINKTNVIYNLSEPYYASSWFPCHDIPSDKALLDIYITNDSSDVSVSNGTLEDINVNGARKTYHWKTLYPIASYLVCIYSANYVTFSDKYISQDRKDTLPILYYVFPNQLENAEIDFKEHPKFIDFFARTFGEYPFIKEKYGVAEFLWQFGAMEHQTITGIGSNFVMGKQNFNDIYTHELAHHWWGDAVSPADWKDIWLNEGFATYSEALYAEHIGGRKALQTSMLNKSMSEKKGTVYDPGDNMFGTTVYDKGSWVLHMLRKETGDSLFFKILRTYFETYKYKNASTEDFINICQSITGKNLTKFFDQWVYKGEGKIELEYTWSFEKTGNDYKLNISFLQTQKGYKDYNFPLDIKIVLDNGTNVYKTIYIDSPHKDILIPLKEIPRDIEMDSGTWLLASFINKKS